MAVFEYGEVYFIQKQRYKYPQIFSQLISDQNITNAPEIICNKHESHIGACTAYHQEVYLSL